MGDELWGDEDIGQVAIAVSVSGNRWVVVRASKGVGKTWLAARLVAWFLCTRIDSLVITTANKWQQVELQLWAEIRDAWAASANPLPGTPLRTKWEPDPVQHPKWGAHGMSPDVPENQAGFHAKASKDPTKAAPVLVVADECSAIPDPRLDALKGLLTNPDSRMLWIANPSRTSGRFYQTFHPDMNGVLWDKLPPERRAALLEDPWEPRRHHINAHMAPEWIVGPDWIRFMRRSCGVNPDVSPLYQCDVEGEFASLDDRKLFPMHLLNAAAFATPQTGGRHMGVDIGRGGRGDPCVAVLTENGRVVAVKAWALKGEPNVELHRTAHIIRTLAIGTSWMLTEDDAGYHRGWDVEPRHVHIDSTGIGRGVTDLLWGMGLLVDPVDFGAGPQSEPLYRHLFRHQPKFSTRREELHWLGWASLTGGHACIPNVPELAPLRADLAEIETKENSRDAFKIEGKDEFKARVGRSPDWSDAWLCSLSRVNPSMVRARQMTPDSPDRKAIRVRVRRRVRSAGRGNLRPAA